MQNTHSPLDPQMAKDENATPNTPVVATKSDKLNPEVEYEVLELDTDDTKALKEKLNELGADGWQLVSATPHFIFRRARKSEDEKPKGRVGFSV